VPATHRGSGELDAVACINILASVHREVILPALDDRIGEHAGTCEPFLNRLLEWLADKYVRRCVSVTVLANELRPDDPSYDERRRAPLHDLADLLADTLERFEPLTLDLGRQDFDLDARKMLGERLASGRLATGMPAHILLAVRCWRNANKASQPITTPDLLGLADTRNPTTISCRQYGPPTPASY
jgi:hypothetical protein